jgi:hypothetical protein
MVFDLAMESIDEEGKHIMVKIEPDKSRLGKPPVDRTYLDMVQKDLYETIKKAEESKDPNVSLAGIAILAKYEKLVEVIWDIKEWGLEKK